jgi:hypothetical protein
MTEAKQGCRIGRAFLAKTKPMTSLGVTTVDLFFRSLICQVEPYPDQMHPHHGLYPFGRPTAFPFKIIRAYVLFRSFSRYKPLHSIQKYVSPVYAFAYPYLFVAFPDFLLYSFLFDFISASLAGIPPYQGSGIGYIKGLTEAVTCEEGYFFGDNCERKRIKKL